MPQIIPDDMRSIDNFDALLDFLREKLEWPIPEGVALEEIVFPWSPEELDLDEPTEGRIIDCQQLPPFPTDQLELGLYEGTQPWGIFFVQFKSESVYRTDLRRVLRGLVERRDRDPSLPVWNHDQLLFICTTDDYQRFAFSHFRSTENWRHAVLSIFSWERGDTHVRTLCEYNLPALVFPAGGFSNDQEWLREWQAAFDVEMVTQKFFAEYQRIFAEVEEAIEGIPDSEEEQRRLYTQRLFNRLMFLRFIEKKKWLTYNGDHDYLRTLFNAAEETDENFLNNRLYWAFFTGLGTAGDSPHHFPEVEERRGQVPFLNGGLFKMQEYDQRYAVHIPNTEFAKILALFERYNFTVTESTPLDIEVAVDPEMLGKVFEELVTGRHDTGSYYTPRPVVSFMCRESLKICLHNKTDETPECLQVFVDDGDATEIRDPEEVLQVLQTLRICDPACGSGAYLLGMMSELLRLRDALFQSNQIDSRTTYQRKMDIIRENLYGVDNDEFAVNIAMLRLWLSLAVDYEGNQPKPLPNLDYKVAVGDSVTGPAPERPDGQLRSEDSLIQQIQEHKSTYLVTYTDLERQEIQEAIAELEEGLQGWSANQDEFVWQIEFSEVFQEGGFDIIISNPPYVRHEKIKRIKPILRRRFASVYTSTADLYVYFYKRGAELLRAGGMLTYISSNKFLRAGYGRKLRQLLTDKMCLQKLLDFGSVPVFGAAVNTCIVLVENAMPTEETFLAATFRDRTDIPRLSEVFQERAFSMHIYDLPADGWALTSPEALRLLKKLQQTGTPLGAYIDEAFHMGVKTGCNDAFLIDSSTRQQLIAEDIRSSKLIKPLIRGKDIGKWVTEPTEEYMIAIASSANLEWPWSEAESISAAERIFEETYPAIYRYLNAYRESLIDRVDQGTFYWELRSCAYYAKFEKPKIIYRDIAKVLSACYDTKGTFGLNTTFFIPTSDLSLLAILNSQLFDWYARHKFQTLNDPWTGGGLRFFAQYLQRVPIAACTEAQKASLSHLVERILIDPECDEVRILEEEIDEQVYQLYGLTCEEIALIKQTYEEAGMQR